MMQEQAPITIEAVDIGQILTTLPHRYSHAVDRSRDRHPQGLQRHRRQNVTVNEPQFAGLSPSGRSIRAC